MRTFRAAILVLCVSTSLAWAQVSGDCTVSILNRTAPLDASGRWQLTNLPSSLAPIRARYTCIENGLTRYGQSNLYLIDANRTTAFPVEFTLGNYKVPDTLQLASASARLQSIGASAQLTATVTYADATTANVTPGAQGTVYFSSNPQIAQVSTSGLVTATGMGTALITAVHDGVTAIREIQVAAPVDTDSDGIPDEAELTLLLNPNNPVDALEDLDRDGLTNLDEFRLRTDLRNRDTDGDGLEDAVEVRLGMNPLTVDPTTTVNGRVLDAAGGPVVGATVALLGQFTSVTDPTGAFAFRFVPAGLGNFTVAATFTSGATLLAASSAPVAPVAGGVTDAGSIRLAIDGGAVTGVVISPTGVAVNGAAVTITSGGLVRGATTDASGRYSLAGVLSGAVTVAAVDSASGLQARSSGTLTVGGTLTLNLQLSGAGRVSGIAYLAGGATPAARVPVSITSGSSTQTAVTDLLGRYAFDGVSVGTFTLNASNAVTGDLGRTAGSITSNGEVRTADLVFNGVGQVTVTVRSGAAPVANAAVTLTSQTVFGGSKTGNTAADGTVTFSQVLAGAFSVSASNPANGQSASTTGSVANAATANVTVSFEGGTGTGTISGRVLANDGTTAVAGFAVRLLDLTGRPLTQATSAADGAFRFDSVALGAYNLDTLDLTGRVQAREVNLLIASGGDSVTRNLVLVSTGTVSGRVLNPDSSPAANQAVALRSYHPGVGGFFSATTNAQGQYAIAGVPTGPFYVAAADSVRILLGEASGDLSAGSAVADLTLAANAVSLPLTRYDANNYMFDLKAGGLVGAGSNNVYTNAMALDVLVGAGANRFTGPASATSDQFGRQVSMSQSIAGLEVTRKIFVPRDGFFARYLEVIRNPGATAVTAGVRISVPLSNAQMIETSGGTTAFDTSASPSRSRWAVLDDYYDEDNSNPALAFVFDGTNAATRVTAASYTGQQLSYDWGGISVPPGGTVAILHFAAQQNLRSSARISAEHLSQLPPEALRGLSASDVAAIRNFVVPPGTASFLAPLPSVSGGVTGRVTDYTGLVPLGAAQVFVRSRSAFFSRPRRLTTDAQGNYTAPAALNETGTSTAIPLSPFDVTAMHAPVVAGFTTTPNEQTVPGSFVTGNLASVNVAFINTGNLQVRQVWPVGGAPVSTCTGGSTANISGPSFPGSAVLRLDATGNAAVAGLKPGNYTIEYTLRHPQDGYFAGFCFVGSAFGATQNVQVVAGQALLTPSVIPPVGNITGVVTDSAGAPVAGLTVSAGPPTALRYAITDAAGAYTLRDIPAGATTAVAYDANSGTASRTTGRQPVTVVAGQTVTRPLTLITGGGARVTVSLASGAPAAGFTVQFQDTLVDGTRSRSATTDASGVATFNDVGPGAYSVNAYPSFALYRHQATASGVALAGATTVVNLTMPPVGTVSGTVSLFNGTPVANTRVEFRFASDSLNTPAVTTNAVGGFILNDVPYGVSFKIQTWRRESFLATAILDNQSISSPSETRNLTLPAIATVRVMVINGGNPVPSARVTLTDSVGAAPTATANASGIATFTGIREGNFSVRAFLPNNFVTAIGAASGTVTPGNEGGTIDVTIQPGLSGTIQGTIFAADGATPVPFSPVQIFDIATGVDVSTENCGGEVCQGLSSDENGFFQLSNATVSSLGFRVVARPFYNDAFGEQTGNITSVGQVVTANVTVPLSAVKGTVYLADGVTTVPFANVYGTQAGGSFFGTSDSTGRYAAFGGVAGPFTLTASDPESGLSATASGILPAATSVVAVNVLLQPSGTVTGLLRDSAGQPLANAPVALAVGETGFTRLGTTDASGSFRFERVAVGNFEAQGQNPASGVTASLAGLVSVNQTALANISLPAVGELRGRILRTDGTSGVSNAEIVVGSLAGAGPLGIFETFTAADASGNYQTAGVQQGPTRVAGSDPLNPSQVGLGDGVVTAGIPAAINAVLGTGVRMGSFALDGADGFRYDLGCDGELRTGGTVDGRADPAFAGDASPPVNYGCSAARIELSGRQIVLGPVSPTGLLHSRKAYVPAAGRFIRYLDTVTNPTAAAIAFDYEVTGALASFDKTRVLTAPSSNGGRYALTDSTTCCEPVVAHVFAGSGGRVGLVDSRFVNGNGGVSYKWRVTVPAGQSISLLHFVVQRDRNDAAGAEALAQALATLSDPDGLTGLTAEERARVANFLVP